MTELTEAYNRGFDDGLKWAAYCLRLAADQVEKPTIKTFERQSDGATFEVITKSGQVYFANQLRSVANEIETAIQKATPDGPQT